jgi:Gram-negative bacterial TonB protein C-terminal
MFKANGALLLTISLVLTGYGHPQQTMGSPVPEGQLVILRLVSPNYPPLARQANISGDVELRLAIRKDGALDSLVVVGGHPMLREAAVNSAQQSRFECRGCTSEVTFYSLIYSFQVKASPDWPCPKESGPHVVQRENHITITAEPALVDPYFSYIQARSPKCLYLWRCGYQWGGEDYYYYRVRSAKCLGLWSCAHRLREPFATCKKLHRGIS